ncbi:MAG: hypothetical protein AMXMBFR7_30090 [Planctomycetota bacterium]
MAKRPFYTLQLTPPPDLLARLAVVSIGHFQFDGPRQGQRLQGWHVEHLHYTLAGGAVAQIAGQTYRARAGSLWFTPKDQPYTYATDPETGFWEGLWIEFDGAWVREAWRMLGLDGVIHVPNAYEAGRVVEAIHARLRSGGEAALYESSAQLLELFALLRRIAHAQPGRRDAGSAAVANAQAYAREHLADPLDLGALAKIAHLSPHHFARLFHAHTGFTPLHWLRSERVGRAQELFRQGGLNVSEVGRAVGYPVVQQFSRVFKRATGIGPRQFVRSLPR